MPRIARTWATLPLLLASGCAGLIPAGDRIEVQQGNLLDDADIAALELGMPRAAVRDRLGTPVLGTSFNRDRWDYIHFRTEAGRDTGEVQRLSLHFEGDQLARIEGEYAPPEPPDPDELPEVDDDEPIPGEAPAEGEPPAPGETGPSPTPAPDGGGAPGM